MTPSSKGLTCGKVIISLGFKEQQGAHTTHHLKEDPASGVDISCCCHSGAELALWGKVLGVHLRGGPALGSPAPCTLHNDDISGGLMWRLLVHDR